MPDDPMSLFSSKQTKKKRIKKDEEAPRPALVVDTPQVPPPDQAETVKMLENMQAKQRELDTKISDILKKGHLLPQELQALLKDLSNWPEKKQEEIFRKANQIIDQLNEAIGKGSVEVLERKSSKKDDKRSQKAQKIRGKRNWISMQ